MQVSKEKICKCGHFKSDHYIHPKTKLSIITECQRCRCSEYMNRKHTGRILSIYGIVMSGLCIMIIGLVGVPISMMSDKINVPVNIFGIILSAMMILVILQLMPNMTLAYFNYKRRKEYPVE